MPADATHRPCETGLDPPPEIGALLRDPAVRHPLKAVLRAWAARDPIDAATDAHILAVVFGRRADARLADLCDPSTGDPR